MKSSMKSLCTLPQKLSQSTFAIWLDESSKAIVATIATSGNFSLLDLVWVTLKKV